MTIARSWTYDDENTEHNEAMRPVLDKLAAEWSELSTEIENEGFRRQAAYDDGDDPGDHFDTKEELQAWMAGDRIRRELKQMQLGNIEAMLAQHGARMMRPYEHWNEDEAYMQYMEVGRFGSEEY